LHKARFFKRLSIHEGLDLAATPLCQRPLPSDAPLYLYGAGNLGKLADGFLDAVGHPAIRTIERDDLAMGADRAMRIARPQIAVAVITAPYMPIERRLCEEGFEDVDPFYDLAWNFRDRHPLGWNGWWADPLSTEDCDRIVKVWDRWEDDRSRAHHLQFIAWRRIREEWSFANAPVTNEDRYFIPEVVAALHDHEVFLDGGAYHGEVTKRFVELIGGAYRQIWAFDADQQNASASEVATLVCALGAVNGSAFFRSGFGYASRLVGPRDAAMDELLAPAVEMRTIDHFDLPLTFIKLHLEGAELNALKGGRETLIKLRPIVAATVYHNSDGIYRTAEWMMENMQDYRFLFRNHCWQGAGAVIYAIPCERKR
jgi:hypothetical protein